MYKTVQTAETCALILNRQSLLLVKQNSISISSNHLRLLVIVERKTGNVYHKLLSSWSLNLVPRLLPV